MAMRIIEGTEFELNINIPTINDMTMDDYDFTVEVRSGSIKPKSCVFEKKDAVRVDSNNYVFWVDTSKLGTGNIQVEVVAFLPSKTFNKERKEIVVIETDIEVRK